MIITIVVITPQHTSHCGYGYFHDQDITGKKSHWKNKINIQILTSLGRLEILSGSHVQKNFEAMSFPGSAGGGQGLEWLFLILSFHHSDWFPLPWLNF